MLLNIICWAGTGRGLAQIPTQQVCPIAAYERTEGVTLCFFGDGVFFKGRPPRKPQPCANLESPYVYIVENNQWGMGTSWKKVSAQSDFSAAAASYSMKGYACDGMDVVEVRETVAEAVAEARSGAPAFVEARTYRYKGHSMSDPQKYRTRDEIDKYRKRDPILFLKGRLEDEKLLSPEEWDALSARVDAVIEEAVSFAESSPEPALGELFADMLA